MKLKRVEITALPSTKYEITTLIDFNSPVLGTQQRRTQNHERVQERIAPRTFCFLHELEMLIDNNLVKGGDINNAIVIVDKPVTEDEMSRLAKAFGRQKVEVKTEGYPITWNCVSRMNRPATNCSMLWATSP